MEVEVKSGQLKLSKNDQVVLSVMSANLNDGSKGGGLIYPAIKASGDGVCLKVGEYRAPPTVGTVSSVVAMETASAGDLTKDQPLLNAVAFTTATAAGPNGPHAGTTPGSGGGGGGGGGNNSNVSGSGGGGGGGSKKNMRLYGNPKLGHSQTPQESAENKCFAVPPGEYITEVRCVNHGIMESWNHRRMKGSIQPLTYTYTYMYTHTCTYTRTHQVCEPWSVLGFNAAGDVRRQLVVVVPGAGHQHRAYPYHAYHTYHTANADVNAWLR